MKMQLKTEVRGVLFELSVEEAFAALADPAKIQDEIRSMLTGAGYTLPDPDAPHRRGGRNGHRQTCTLCNKSGLSPRGMKVHMTRMHPEAKQVE